MKIYLASSWKNIQQQKTVALLRDAGFEVYDFKQPEPGVSGFSWAEIDPDWQKWTLEQYTESLKHECSERGFLFDMNGLESSDICVLLLPCGRSAHVEAGWCSAKGKKVYVLCEHDWQPELMYKLFNGCFATVESLIEHLKSESNV